MATRKWALRKFQGFSDTITDINGLNFNARYFDRTFLNKLDKADWQKAAKEIQNELTDSVIHTAVNKMPSEIYAKIGKSIEKNLQKRRDDLEKYAIEYYKFLSSGVDITGTQKNDLFRVKRLPGGQTHVRVYALKKKTGEIKDTLYDRIFQLDETKEIRLYGLDGKDRFKVEGKSKKGIKIRIIGGKGKDSIIDTSEGNLGKKTLDMTAKTRRMAFITGKKT